MAQELDTLWLSHTIIDDGRQHLKFKVETNTEDFHVFFF